MAKVHRRYGKVIRDKKEKFVSRSFAILGGWKADSAEATAAAILDSVRRT